MVKLSGILEYSMGGFLCLRGFASFKMLSAISEPNPEVQRNLIAQHQGEMAEFLNGGEYRFFPEVILSLNLTDGRSEFDKIDLFHSELRSGQTWNKSIGGFQISISQNVTKNVVNAFDPSPRLDRINIAHLKFDEKEHRITRIDGNHRLSAAASVREDFAVPFCLLLFQNPEENGQYSRAIFHNINAKQVPLNLEENLKVIYENRPKSIFVSMQFSVETADTYQTIEDVKATLKRENGLDIKLIRVDQHHDGYSDEIYHRIINGIKESSLVIADLSFGNKNVHHEIGYAQGLAKKVLLLYKTRDRVPANSEIGSNISMHDQVRFQNQVELRPVLLRKIREFFGIEVDD